MIFQSVDLMTITRGQGEIWFNLGPLAVPKWGILMQPIGFLVFVTAIFAETNRLPFDLAEGESEIIAGYHLEYGAMKFALFMLAEYVNMTVGAAVIATLFLGGWQLLPGMEWVLMNVGLTGFAQEMFRVLLEITSFILKMGVFLWLFVWVRWTLPRFRYDQLMDFGWKVMLPLCFANIIVTTVLIYLGVF
jgi:NADH-quinone oxidoreductase subunit H